MNKEPTRHKPFLSTDHCMKYLKQIHPSLNKRETQGKSSLFVRELEREKWIGERFRVSLYVVSWRNAPRVDAAKQPLLLVRS